MSSFEQLSNVLGIDHNMKSPTSNNNIEIIPDKIASRVEELTTVVYDDFDTARKTYTEVLQIGTDALRNLHEVAVNGENARTYEVLATLIKTLSDTATGLYSLHKITNEINKPMLNNNTGIPSSINANNSTIFVGTTADLLTKLKEIKKYEKELKDEGKVIDVS